MATARKQIRSELNIRCLHIFKSHVAYASYALAMLWTKVVLGGSSWVFGKERYEGNTSVG